MISKTLRAVFASVALGACMSPAPQPDTGMSRAQRKELDAILKTVQDNFVLGPGFSSREKNERIFLGSKTRSDPFTDQEFTDAANRLMRTLDPHSHYSDARETSAGEQSDNGYVVGIGVRLSLQDEFPMAYQVLPGSPAERAGMKKNDIILHVSDSTNNVSIDTNDADLERASDAIRGAPGTDVTIQVRRKGNEQPVTLTVRRARVDFNPVKYEFDNDVGYIKLDQFNGKAASSVEDAIAAIEKAHGAQKGYIFDLRGNPGGMVPQAMQILADLATRPAQNVITMKGSRSNIPYHIETAKNLLKDRRLIVLIDENSASASELTSGALKDLGRAEIYGKQSYGKGSAFQRFPMPSGNRLAVTVQLYYLPSGKSIQLQGVVPDVVYLPTQEQTEKFITETEKSAKKLRDKFPDNPDKRLFYSESSYKNALVLTDPSVLDHSQPAQTCSLVSETPAPETPAPLIQESVNIPEPPKLDSIKTCAWESLTGVRLNTRIAPYHGESLRFTSPAP